MAAAFASARATEKSGDEKDPGKFNVGLLKSIRKEEFGKLDTETQSIWVAKAKEPVALPDDPESKCVTSIRDRINAHLITGLSTLGMQLPFMELS